MPATSGGADWWAVDHLFLDQVEGLRDDRRDAALAVLRAAAANGFDATEYRRSAAHVSAPITLPGVPGTPVTLDEDFCCVSLGRNHPALLEPIVNGELRGAILRVSPSSRQAKNPKKGEVGIRLDSIDADGRDHLPGLFGVLEGALTGS